ncbi:alpha/beta fold hydrolase [Thiopseudomonas alkaliphila]|uniref:alpha/beta fold hydrolase n=1 Tax=Thiopseudomonas alkaliphila TaxID=1697053 RepID=UPI0035716B2E
MLNQLQQIRRLIAANLLFILLAGTLTACQTPQHALEHLATQHNYQLHKQLLAGLPLVSLVPKQTNNSRILRIYLEGDGRAWINRSQPSLDPTPRHLLIAQLAMQDPLPSIYLARPCQFIKHDNCRIELWTHARFSQEVLTSLSLALDQLRSEFKNDRFELVGYSGGGTLALLLAAQRTDITQVQTIAGNLSPRLWAKQHNLTPLSLSLDPLDYAEQLKNIKQRHFVGALDSNTSPELFKQYIEQLIPRSTCIERITVANADHKNGWEHAWNTTANQPITCLTKHQLMQ